LLNLLHIEFGRDSDALILSFKIRDTALAQRWVKKVRAAQRLQYPIDEPDRFYGFNSIKREQERALDHINEQIRIINSYQRIIDRKLKNINDQDTLNYLHNIFERYHGLLDQQQQNEFFRAAPEDVQKALATLNTAVHRCETVDRGNQRRTVITYYGLPKKHTLEPNDYDLIERDWKFGAVHLCYVEIGKTLLDLSQDNDAYIGDDAFRPYHFYSADFVVQFNDSDPKKIQETEQRMWDYYEQHRDFFESRGYPKNHPALKMGIFPVADLVSSLSKDSIVRYLRERQNVNRVWFT
jgi:hypothetical protein